VADYDHFGHDFGGAYLLQVVTHDIELVGRWVGGFVCACVAEEIVNNQIEGEGTQVSCNALPEMSIVWPAMAEK
jgi:hypothetical protein